MSNGFFDITPIAFHETHELRTRTGDDRDMVVLSGYAEVLGDDLKGNPDGSWNRKWLGFDVGPRWQGADPREIAVVPVASMTSITDVGGANNAGWAVDECQRIDTPHGHTTQISLRIRVGVRDRDAFMFRVNYYVTMVGILA